jgi:hypothetical protein
MPSIAHPAYYERALWVAAGRADEFLKRIDTDEAEETCGRTEAPIGHVMLVKVSTDMIREYVATAGDPWMSSAKNFEPGWYIVREDDNGLVWGLGYGGWCADHDAFCADTSAEEQARADYAEAVEAHDAWDNGEVSF